MAVLTRHYVTKKWPMWELGLALERYSPNGDGSGSSSAGVLLPVVLNTEGLSMQDLGDLMRSVYERPGAWEGKQRPDDATLLCWAGLGKRVDGIVCRKGDQVI